jgi:hypothetical protein
MLIAIATGIRTMTRVLNEPITLLHSVPAGPSSPGDSLRG